MGLDITGKKTDHHISWSYSALHHRVRYLALVLCGLPDKIGTDDIGNDLDAFLAYMNFPDYRKIKMENMDEFIAAIQMSGYYFPNLLMHSDCEGKYTKNGKQAPDTKHWQYGNSKKLLEELELICTDQDLINHELDRVRDALPYAIAFRDLVKDEIENGCGTILFE